MLSWFHTKPRISILREHCKSRQQGYTKALLVSSYLQLKTHGKVGILLLYVLVPVLYIAHHCRYPCTNIIRVIHIIICIIYNLHTLHRRSLAIRRREVLPLHSDFQSINILAILQTNKNARILTISTYLSILRPMTDCGDFYYLL